MITGYSIVFGSLLVMAGRTADRLGSRRVFFAGLGVFCLGLGRSAASPRRSACWSPAGWSRASGRPPCCPSSLALLLGAFPAERRSQMVALWGGIGALAVATGPSFGAAADHRVRLAGASSSSTSPSGWWRGWSAAGCSTSSGPAGCRAAPDYLGVVLSGGALAALVLAISEGPTLGVDESGRSSAAFVGVAVLGAAFLRRSGRHPEPVLDLTLFRSRSFSVANAATLLYAMGFFAMLLGNILFLTSVWHYSILMAGLAVTPGPLVVAVVSGPAGSWPAASGSARSSLAGFVVFAAGLLWYATRIGLQPEYLTVWLPGHPDRRARDRPHLPGPQRRRGLEPPRRTVRGRQRGQPDRPSGGRRAGRGPPGGDPRCPGRSPVGPGHLPPPVVVLRGHGRARRAALPPADAGAVRLRPHRLRPRPRRTPPGRSRRRPTWPAEGARGCLALGPPGRSPSRHPGSRSGPFRAARLPTSPEEIMDQPTEPDADTEAAEQADAGHDHRSDRPPTTEENAAAEERYSASDDETRRRVAEHEQEMMEIGADVKGEGAIE